MVKRITIVLLAAFVGGCASTGTKVETAQVNQFKRGVTTQADVIAALGEPNTRATLEDGSSQIGYVHAEMTTKAATFIPIVGMFAGGMDTQSNAVNFIFDANGKLKSTSSSSSAMDTNMFGSQSK